MEIAHDFRLRGDRLWRGERLRRHAQRGGDGTRQRLGAPGRRPPAAWPGSAWPGRRRPARASAASRASEAWPPLARFSGLARALPVRQLRGAGFTGFGALAAGVAAGFWPTASAAPSPQAPAWAGVLALAQRPCAGAFATGLAGLAGFNGDAGALAFAASLGSTLGAGAGVGFLAATVAGFWRGLGGEFADRALTGAAALYRAPWRGFRRGLAARLWQRRGRFWAKPPF